MRLFLCFMIAAGVAFAQASTQAPSQSPAQKREQDSRLFKKNPKDRDGKLRTLVGVVTLPDNAHVQGAVVRISNQRTGEVRAFITQADGKYRFEGLEREINFAVYAELKGAKSRTRSLTPFDSRDDPIINLTIEPHTETKK
jgi:hypothetical protein